VRRRCRVCQKVKAVRAFVEESICAECDAAIAREALTRIPPIRAALRTPEATADRVVLVARCDHALGQAEALHRFEQMGIPTTSPVPSQLLHELRTRRAALLSAAGPAAPPIPALAGTKPRRPHATSRGDM
jgi:hypothetical protein